MVTFPGVADQLQTNYASDLRHILKCVFEMNVSYCEEEPIVVEPTHDDTANDTANNTTSNNEEVSTDVPSSQTDSLLIDGQLIDGEPTEGQPSPPTEDSGQDGDVSSQGSGDSSQSGERSPVSQSSVNAQLEPIRELPTQRQPGSPRRIFDGECSVLNSESLLVTIFGI